MKILHKRQNYYKFNEEGSFKTYYYLYDSEEVR